MRLYNLLFTSNSITESSSLEKPPLPALNILKTPTFCDFILFFHLDFSKHLSLGEVVLV